MFGGPTSTKKRHIVKHGVDLSGFVKSGFVKHGFVKGGFVNQIKCSRQQEKYCEVLCFKGKDIP